MWRRPWILYWLALLIVLSYTIWSLPESNSAAENQELVKISVDSLNVRERPEANAPIIAHVVKDETYLILDARDDWTQIRLANGEKGWIAGWHAEYRQQAVSKWLSHAPSESYFPSEIEMIHDATRIRSGPQTTHKIIDTVQSGETFSTLDRMGDWLKIELDDGQTGYVAGWVVKASDGMNHRQPREENSLKGKLILIDPGHGGNDVGAIGPHLGTLEKVVNLQVSLALGQKLKDAGATVRYTRSDDRKVPLADRVYLSNVQRVDAFVSIHHNTSENERVNGLITYYYDDGAERKLAERIQEETVKRTGQTDLGARYGNYLILRENYRLAVLCELGFMSHYSEEMLINTRAFQEQAAEGIFEGLRLHFQDES